MSREHMTRDEKAAYLRKSGFLDWEVWELSREANYETLVRNRKAYENPKDDPGAYIQRMIQSRQHNMRRWRAAGLDNAEITRRIERSYRVKKWTSFPKIQMEGLKPIAEALPRLDPYAMLRWFRQRAIESGDYIPPARVSHPGKHYSVKDSKLAEDRREARLSSLHGAKPSKVTNKRDIKLKIDDYNQQIIRAINKGAQTLRRRLELRRDQWQRRLNELP